MSNNIKALIITAALIIGLLPGSVMAGGGAPKGVTLEGWIVGPRGSINGGPELAGISFAYSDGFSTDLALSIPYDTSWKKINDIRPIIEAYKEGYGPNLGGEGGILGTDINFAPNVLAAMKAQNFNPAQVGGANIPPESTNLNDEQIAWLKQMGYSVPAESPINKAAPEVKNGQESVNTKPPQQPTLSVNSEEVKVESELVEANVPSSSVLEAKSEAKADPVDPVGQTVKTPDTTMTQEMVVESKKLAVQDPPKVYEPIISITDDSEQVSEQAQSILKGPIPWIAATLAIIVTIVITLSRKWLF